MESPPGMHPRPVTFSAAQRHPTADAVKAAQSAGRPAVSALAVRPRPAGSYALTGASLTLPASEEQSARFACPLNDSAEKLPHNLTRRGDDRRRDVRRIEQQREAFVIDGSQMPVTREQDGTFEHGAFRENERIVFLLIRQQPSLADFRGNGVHDAMPHRVHGLDSPFRDE